MSSVTGASRIATELFVGLTTAIVALALFLPLSTEWKILGITILAVEGALVFLVMVGWSNKISRRLEDRSRSREIRKHPDLVSELYRLNTRIYQVLYERSSNHPSLLDQGVRAMDALARARESTDLPASCTPSAWRKSKYSKPLIKR